MIAEISTWHAIESSLRACSAADGRGVEEHPEHGLLETDAVALWCAVIVRALRDCHGLGTPNPTRLERLDAVRMFTNPRDQRLASICAAIDLDLELVRSLADLILPASRANPENAREQELPL